MSTININVRPSTGQIFKLDVGTEATIEELKQLIAQKMENVEASNLKLVFSGRILKNEDLVGDCKIVSGCTVHVVRTGTNKAPAAKNNNSNSTATTATNTLENTTSTNSAANITSGQQSTTSNPSSGLLGASSPFGALGDMQMPNMDPELMRQMMDSPFMQNILNNPEFVRSIIMSNPQMKALVEQNPELGHVISDPAFLRQSMEMMRNPNLMREMQRNNDRALSNIEAIPGGFNHLRRMYNTFQGPLESAMSPRESNTNDEAINERLARELNVESVPENSLNTQALPNPWAAPSNRSNNDSSSTTTTAAAAAAAATTNSFGAAFGGSANNTGAMENPFAALFGAGNAFSLSQQQQQQQQQQTPFWADPNFIQASLRLQQAMMSAQNNNNNNNNNNSQQQPNLFQQMFMGGFPSNNGFGFPTTQPATSTEPPEVRFREQLAQLEEMGFTDKSANIRALLATGGNVQAAVEYLLSM